MHLGCRSTVWWLSSGVSGMKKASFALPEKKILVKNKDPPPQKKRDLNELINRSSKYTYIKCNESLIDNSALGAVS